LPFYYPAVAERYADARNFTGGISFKKYSAAG
jgi:hypothetical protein